MSVEAHRLICLHPEKEQPHENIYNVRELNIDEKSGYIIVIIYNRSTVNMVK